MSQYFIYYLEVIDFSIHRFFQFLKHCQFGVLWETRTGRSRVPLLGGQGVLTIYLASISTKL